MDASSEIVSIEGLVKRYGELIAVDHLSLHIQSGEIFGLLGPNGCGKTTTIDCALSLLAYDKGDIRLFGEEMSPTRYDLKRRIGMVPQEVAVYDELTVRENIDAFCALYVDDRKRRRGLVDEAIGELIDRLLRNAPNAQAQCKAILRQVADRPIDETLIIDTVQRAANARSSAEGQEGIAAFIEKRRPNWSR